MKTSIIVEQVRHQCELLCPNTASHLIQWVRMLLPVGTATSTYVCTVCFEEMIERDPELYGKIERVTTFPDAYIVKPENSVCNIKVSAKTGQRI